MKKEQKREYQDTRFATLKAAVTEHQAAGLRSGTYEIGDKFALIIFAENRKHPICHCAFTTVARRDEYLNQVIDKAIADNTAAKTRREEAAKNNNAKAKEFAGALKKGDIFSASWGWEQTNVDFYEVAAVKGLTVTLLSIAADITETGFMSGEATPRPGEYTGKTLTRRVAGYSDVATVKINDWTSARVWDGRPEYVSWYA